MKDPLRRRLIPGRRTERGDTVGQKRFTILVIPEGAQGPVRQFTIPLALLRRGLAAGVTLATLALVGIGLAINSADTTLSGGRLLDENLALRGRLGEIEGKLQQVEREMQRLRLYRTQLEDLPPEALPGFGPIEADELDAARALGEGVVVDVGREEVAGEAGAPMDDLPDAYGPGATLSTGVGEVGGLDGIDRRVDRLLAALRVAEIELGNQAEAAEHLRSMEQSVPSGWPVQDAVLTSGYGWRRSPFTRRWKFHAGVDLATTRGAPVVAPAQGTVITADFQSGYGKVIQIDHGYGIVTRYAHNARLMVAQGQVVRRGQLIATVGMTGATTGPHLHYEIHVEGVPVDPLEYLE